LVVADYFKTIEQLLSNSKLIADRVVDFKEFSSDEGMVRGRLLLLGGYVLTFMEYIQIGKERPKYRFNHHKHTKTEVKPSREIGLAEVLSETEIIILNEFYN